MGRHTVLVVLLALFIGADGFVPSFLARPIATAATTAAPQRYSSRAAVNMEVKAAAAAHQAASSGTDTPWINWPFVAAAIARVAN